MQKMGTIYKHTLIADCPSRGKSYIGQTCQSNIAQRWRNGNGYLVENASRAFSNAIKKYGGDNFTHEILESNITSYEEANEREQYGIAHYHTGVHDPECWGYNTTPGGDAVEGTKLMYKDGESHKVAPCDFESYLAAGGIFHTDVAYRPTKHKLGYTEHKAEQNERTKQYYQEHKEELRERNKANCKIYYQSEEFRARKKAYRKAHREQELLTQKKSYEKHKSDPEYKRKHAEANKRWRERQKIKMNNIEDDI